MRNNAFQAQVRNAFLRTARDYKYTKNISENYREYFCEVIQKLHFSILVEINL